MKLLDVSFINKEVEVSFSGGKDSAVILELAKMASLNYRVIYKKTTIDPPGTIKYCKEMGAEILPPKRPFFDIIKAKGFPSRFARFCCSELKEYKVLDNSIHKFLSLKEGLFKEDAKKLLEDYFNLNL